MQVATKILVLFLIGCLLHYGNATDCPACISRVGWRDCKSSGTAVTCTRDQVNAFHESLSETNPNLLQGGPEDDGFKCFAMHLRRRSNLSDLSEAVNFLDAYIMGCTFAETRFCSGWPTSEVTVQECETFKGLPSD